MNNILSKLIVRYPLLWNTRFPIAFGGIIAINLFYILIGFLSKDAIIKDLIEDGYSRDNFFESGLILLTIIINILFIIIWLLYYLRNNALKANYPVSTARLISEFLQIAIIIILNFTLYSSYRTGIILGFNTKYDFSNIEKEREILNYAAPYTTNNYYDYELNSYCANEFYGEKVIAESSYNKLKTDFCCNDTIRSYYYYCDFPYVKSTNHKWELVRYNQNLLEKKDRNQIVKHINDYNALCDKYDLMSKKVDAEKIVNKIFATKDFRVEDTYIDEVIVKNSYPFYYGKDASYIIDNIIKYSEFGNNFFETILVLILIGLGFSMVILSFRLTSIKEWLIAVVSLGIISIITGIFLALGGFREIGISVILILIYLVFISIAVFGKELGVNKIANGTAINLSLFTAPYLGLAFLNLIRVDVSYDEFDKYTYTRPYFDDSETIFLSILIGLVLTCIILAVTPKYRASSEG